MDFESESQNSSSSSNPEGLDSDNDSQGSAVSISVEERQRNEERDQLYNLREMHLESLHRLNEEIFDAEIFCTFTADELSIRKQRIQKHFNDFEHAHTLFRQICVMASNNIYVEMESRFMSAMSKLEGRIRELSGTEPNGFMRSEIAANSTLGPLGSTILRVETARPPQIGKFDGNAAHWPAFRDLFIAEVHNRELEPVNKLLYLQEACTGKAASTLGPWQPTGENYKAAWEVMMAAYDDEYHVVHGILGELFAVQKYEKDNYDSLRSVLDGLTGATRQLETIGDPAMLWQQVCIHIAKQRLPKSTLDSWERSRNRNKTSKLPTLEEFKRFLDIQSRGRRAFEPEDESMNRSSSVGHNKRLESGGNRFKPYDKTKSNRSTNPFTTKRNESHGSGGPTKCIMSGCNQTHYLGQCDLFRGLSLTERVELTRQHRLCKCCLTTGHWAFSCTRNGCAKCPEDKMKHHFRLCPKLAAEAKPAAAGTRKAIEPPKQ